MCNTWITNTSHTENEYIEKLYVTLYIELKNVHVIEWLIVSVLGLPQHYALDIKYYSI